MKKNLQTKAIERLNTLNITGIAAVIIDNKKNILQANDLFFKYFNCDLSQIQDHNYIDFIVKNFPRFNKLSLQRWVRRKLLKHRSQFLLNMVSAKPNIASPKPKDITEKGSEEVLTPTKKRSKDSNNTHLSKASSQESVYYYVQVVKAEFELNQCKIITMTDISSAISLLNYKADKNRLKHKDLKVARRIQKSINNYSIPYVEGRYLKYHCTSLFLPKSILSGDILNMRQVNRRYFSFFIGDGRGHGLSAALYSTLLNSYTTMMSAQILRGITDPAFLMRKVNKLAYRDFSQSFNHTHISSHLKEQYFFSGIFGIVDGNNRSMKITNAGHPFAYCLYNGKIDVLPSDGPLVGILANEEFDQQTVQLKDGQLYLFFTDGMYDIVPANLELSFNTILLDHITKLYQKVNYDSTEFLIEFKKYIHTQQEKGSIQDDLSLLTLRIEEKS